MTNTELAVVVLGLLAGYWFVSSSLGKPKSPPGDARAAEPPPYEPTGDRPSPDAEEPQAEAESPHRHVAPRAWHDVLGVRASATRDEVSRAYKSKISQYHPDKVAQMGPEIREVAELKSKEINDAYRTALGR